ncbi:MAG: HU family DNA-binding protein [Bacilli bacterium]|nr:HU family DNA-binding protein [Bacilli bacterium]
MNKHDLIKTIYEKTGIKQTDVKMVVDMVFQEMSLALERNEKILIQQFGSFEARHIKPFDIYSPYDGSLIKNVQQVRVTFKSSPHLKKNLVDKST